MGELERESSNQRPGDKIRIRSGVHSGHRGKIRTVSEEAAEVQLDDGSYVFMPLTDITNYSRAARKAWQVMPKRAGRPRSTRTKKLVSIRLEATIWDQLGEAVRRGWISSREQAINDWLQTHVDVMFARDAADVLPEGEGEPQERQNETNG